MVRLHDDVGQRECEVHLLFRWSPRKYMNEPTGSCFWCRGIGAEQPIGRHASLFHELAKNDGNRDGRIDQQSDRTLLGAQCLCESGDIEVRSEKLGDQQDNTSVWNSRFCFESHGAYQCISSTPRVNRNVRLGLLGHADLTEHIRQFVQIDIAEAADSGGIHLLFQLIVQIALEARLHSVQQALAANFERRLQRSS